MTKHSKNPWQTRSIQEIYDNPWITVSHREVTAPTGNDGIYGVVHFKNTAVGVVPIDDEGNTWLVGQHRYTINEYTWEIPEGGSALGENTLTTAKRELKEETGISASRWTPLFEMHTSNSVTDESAIGYVAQGLTYGSAEPDDTEILQLKKIPLSDAVDMAMQGLITDSLAMVSLLKIQLMIDRGELDI